MSRPFPAWLIGAVVIALLVQSLAPAGLSAGARLQQAETTPLPSPGTEVAATPPLPEATPLPALTETPPPPLEVTLPAPTSTITATVPFTDTTVITPETGGLWQSADGKVTLAAPPGAVTRPVRLRALSRRELPAGLAQWPLLFGFELRDAATDATVATLAAPLTLTWRGGAIEQRSEVRLWRVDAANQSLEAVPSFNPTATGFSADLTASGVYAASTPSTQNQFVLPDIQAGQMDTFTGDSSYSYSLDVPAGAGGLSLPITLRYSGGGPNTAGEGTTADGGWVGAGWTLDLGHIVTTKWDEKGSLSLDGLSSKLVQDPNKPQPLKDENVTEPDLPGCVFMGDPAKSIGAGWTDATWRGQDEKFALIKSHRFSSNMNGMDPGSRGDCFGTNNLLMMGSWDVWAKNGLHYRFGSDQITAPNYATTPPSSQGSRLAYWLDDKHTRRYSLYKLDTVTDPHGNTIRVEYEIKLRCDGGNCERRMHKEAYPKRILYTTNTANGDNHAEYEITFDLAQKDVDPKADTPMAETGWYLTKIKVLYRAAPNAPAQLIRRYDLTYENYNAPDPQMYLLKSIQQFGSDDASALPATTFTYYFDPAYQVGWKSNSNFAACGWSFKEQRPFLKTINNGYDGQVQFDYIAQCLPNGYTGCSGSDVGDGMLQKAQRRTVTAGAGPAQVTEYQHFEPSYERVANCSWEDLTKLKEFIGYERVIADAKGTSGQLLRRTETTFDNAWDDGASNGKPNAPLRGRVLQTVTGKWTGTAWQERTRVDTIWATIKLQSSVENGGSWPADLNFVYPSEVQTTEVAADGSSWDRKVKNYSDIGWQDACNAQGGQYGNLTRVEEYGQVNSATPFRTTVYGYCPNTSAWILDRVALQNVYAGAAPTQPGGAGRDSAHVRLAHLRRRQDQSQPELAADGGQQGRVARDAALGVHGHASALCGHAQLARRLGQPDRRGRVRRLRHGERVGAHAARQDAL